VNPMILVDRYLELYGPGGEDGKRARKTLLDIIELVRIKAQRELAQELIDGRRVS